MNRTRVLLAFGGESSEHDVSVSSAKNVWAAIDRDKFDVVLCFIDETGKWYKIDTFDDYQDLTAASRLLPNLGEKSFVNQTTNGIIPLDVVMPVLHGKNGEDGSVQGLAQLLHIPIVGCDVTASAIGMDKLASKEIMSSLGVQIVPYEIHKKDMVLPDFKTMQSRLGTPLFIKPSRAGSSVGVTKVHTESEFIQALGEAHKHDNVALIEKAIAARELEVAVLGTPPHHKASGVGEIVPGEDFYSYEDKYASTSKAQATIPADLPSDLSQKVRSLAMKVYEGLGCSGLSRVDFFLDESGTVYFNEINTLPGFTDISMYPKLWQQGGISYTQLITLLIDDALNSATIEP